MTLITNETRKKRQTKLKCHGMVWIYIITYWVIKLNHNLVFFLYLFRDTFHPSKTNEMRWMHCLHRSLSSFTFFFFVFPVFLLPFARSFDHGKKIVLLFSQFTKTWYTKALDPNEMGHLNQVIVFVFVYGEIVWPYFKGRRMKQKQLFFKETNRNLSGQNNQYIHKIIDIKIRNKMRGKKENNPTSKRYITKNSNIHTTSVGGGGGRTISSSPSLHFITNASSFQPQAS